MNPAARRGFTLVELLTVICIISILAGILVPVINTVQVSARKAKSTANLQSIGHALVSYTQDPNNKGLLPAPIYGQSNVPGSAPGSANPRQASWLEEIIEYLEGTTQPVAGSKAVVVLAWPPVMTDPQFLALNSAITEPEKRGYGMNTKPYLADPKNPNRTNDFSTQRQPYNKMPNLGNNVIVATSNDVTITPGDDGSFERDGDTYANGDPTRYRGYGLYLFMDMSVQPLTPEEAQKVFAPLPTN
jgi:prepilin-type N-terminal cleavage/methylation domain-containing protein